MGLIQNLFRASQRVPETNVWTVPVEPARSAVALPPVVWTNPEKTRRAQTREVRSYAAAAVNRLTADWSIQNLSPDTELFRALRIMRARSRDLSHRDPYFRQFVALVKKNVVGSAGFRLNVRAVSTYTKDGSPVYDVSANRIISAAWDEFSKKANFTTSGTQTRPEFERMLIGTVAIDGEAFVRRVKGFDGNSFRYALQMIPADCLDERLNTNLPNGNYIRLGVEKDKWDRPVAYHLRRNNPVDFVSGNGTEMMIPTERIPASEILHLYIQEAPQQTRGVPWLFAAMVRLQMLGAYEEAELVAARVSACKLGFITNSEGVEYEGDDLAGDGSQLENAEPGQFKELLYGQDVKQFDPQHPNAAFAEFHRAMMRGVAMAGGVAHHSITGDLSQVNYSSARIGLLDERETWMVIQGWFKDHFCNDVFADWLEMAMVTQKVPLPMSKFDKFNVPTWRGRRWSWVDPAKEVAAFGEAVDRGFTSITKVIDDMNGDEDFETITAERAREKQILMAAGLWVEPSAIIAGRPKQQPETPAPAAKKED